MKRFLPLIVILFIFQSAGAQIVITATDMPVRGDMLCYSNAPMGLVFDPADSGANVVWNYGLSSTSKGVDTYKLAIDVSPSFASTISLFATGYKIADSIPGLTAILSTVSPFPFPISITDIYTYFEQINTPRSAYIASARSYNIKSLITLPTAANYSSPDVWYFFPLTYGNPTDSTNYSVTMSLMSTASIKQQGYRKTRVDGWGTITTPFYTTPVSCIRVRSVIHEIDSVEFSGTPFGFARDMVEYKWLANGVHYPVLWITSTVVNDTERVTQVRYRDSLPAGPVNIVNNKPVVCEITAFPNPATNGRVTLGLPAQWKIFQVEVFDVNAKLVAVINNEHEINLASFSAGKYFIRVTSGTSVGYASVVR